MTVRIYALPPGSRKNHPDAFATYELDADARRTLRTAYRLAREHTGNAYTARCVVALPLALGWHAGFTDCANAWRQVAA